MKNLKFKQNKIVANLKLKRGGFTLVEVLVAMSIMSLSILAGFTAVSNNIRGSNFAEDQMVAYYLADEGLEYVANMRDQNGIANVHAFATGGSVPWLQNIAQNAGDPCFNKTCVIDSPNNTISACAGGPATCPVLKIDPATGLYGYTAGWTPTQFQRVITITVNSPTEATVACTVSWTTAGVSKNYVVTEELENWQ